MSTKLYPPYIEGTIPAFSGTVITVPFSMNKAVSKHQVAGFVLKIKTVQSNIKIAEFSNTKISENTFEKGEIEFEIPDNSPAWDYLNVGQYYKVQLAYLTSDGKPTPSYTVGFYSTVGVVKFTTEPKIEISGLTYGQINNHNYHYVGHYSQETTDPNNPKDTTEKLYSSKFKVFDAKGALIEESEEILHNVTNDIEIYESYEEWTLQRDLEINQSYYIQFIATTTNNMKLYSPRYRLMQKKSIESELKGDFIAALNYDEGYVDLTLKGVVNELGLEEPETGAFVISRTSNEENNVWNEIVRFKLEAEIPSRFLWRDFTVKQGVKYTYSIQQYNDAGLYSDRILSKIYNEKGDLVQEPLFVDFEDMFLFDGKRQLKVQYNPQVSSFNKVIQESKSETIGSKHPFIFKNGAVDYKEFPISGLISYLMDEAKLFLNEEEFTVENKTTNLIGENFVAERNFKMKVLDWLTNGEPKLFRSPGEGNFIVRLMNVSMSPNATVGRMLHTFNANATEIADFTYKNLSKYNLIDTNDPNLKQIRWTTVNLSGHNDKLAKWADTALARKVDPLTGAPIHYGSLVPETLYNVIAETFPEFNGLPLDRYIDPITREVLAGFRTEKSTVDTATGVITISPYGLLQEKLMNVMTFTTGKINTLPITSIYFTDMMPGTKFTIEVKENERETREETIYIGATGTYKVEECGEILSLIIPEGQRCQGTITYSYISSSQNLFDMVNDIEIIDVPCRQFWGNWSETYVDITTVPFKTITTRNIKDAIEDCKTTLLELYKIHIRKRRLQKLYVPHAWSGSASDAALDFYYDMYCSVPFKKEDADPYTVYDLHRGFDKERYKEIRTIEGEKYYVDANDHILNPKTGFLYDPIGTNGQGKKIRKEEYSPMFYYNDSEVSLYKTEEFILENIEVEDFKSLILDNGVFAELTYQVRVNNYSFEYEGSEYQNVYMARGQYNDALVNYKAFKKRLDESVKYDSLPTEEQDIKTQEAIETEKNLIDTINVYYKSLVQELDQAILEYKEANAIS